MSEIYVKSANLVSTPDENQPILKTLLLSLPQNRGTLFAMVRILGTKNEHKTRIVDLIEDHLKRLQNTLGEQVNVPRRFEQVLQAINEDIARVASEDMRTPISDFHAVVGVIHKNQIFFSGTGSLYTLFMHKTVKQRYVLYELSDQYKIEEDKNWDKLFVTVLDGELNHGDIFYLATKISAREMSIADLQDTLVTLPPSGALKRVQQHLHTDTTYAGICFHVDDKPRTGPPKKVNPISSIEHLGKTQDDTANLLGEQSPDFGSFLNKISEPIIKKLSSPGSRGTKSTVKNIFRVIIKVSVFGIAAVAKIISILFKHVIKIGSKGLTLIQDKEKRNSIKNTVRDLQKKTGSTYRRMPSWSKYVGLAAVLLIAILFTSFSIRATQKEKKELNETFDTTVQRIVDNTDAASASLIYNNNAQARELLEEALTLLETLPPDHKQYESTVNDLKADIEIIYSSLRGVEIVNVTVVADLNTINAQENFSSLVSVDGVIYGVSQTGILYRYQELEQQLVQEENINGAIGTVLNSTSYTGGFVFIDSNQRLGRANTVSNTLNPVVSGVEGLQSVEDIVSYNNNIYAISAAAQQIVKMQPQADGFDGGTAWIKSQNKNISTARSIAIDGDIYVLTSSTIVKYTSGLEQTFNLSAIDPSLQNPTELETMLGSDYLYVLDASEARVIIFNKNGEFVTQYTNEAFASGIEIFIQEDKNAIIVGTDTRLLRFTATHLLQ